MFLAHGNCTHFTSQMQQKKVKISLDHLVVGNYKVKVRLHKSQLKEEIEGRSTWLYKLDY